MKSEVKNFDNEAIKAQVAEILKKHGLDFRIEKVPMVGLNSLAFGVDKEGKPNTMEVYLNSEAKKFMEKLEHPELITMEEWLNYVKTGMGNIIDIVSNNKFGSTYFGLVNTKSNEIINTVKNSYHVSQNDEVVELVVRGMRNFGELTIQKAGSLFGGRKTFLQLAIEGLGKVGNDTIKKYVTVLDSNDGSTGLSVGIGDITMSCSNQFFRFYKRGEMKLKHSSSLEAKMAELPSLIKIALEESMKQIEVYNIMQSTAASKALVDGLVRELLGFDRLTKDEDEHSSKSINSMDVLYKHIAKEMNGKGENLWGLFSGVTSWVTHDKSHPKRENGQIESIMTGTNYRTNLSAFTFALEATGQSEFVLM